MSETALKTKPTWTEPARPPSGRTMPYTASIIDATPSDLLRLEAEWQGLIDQQSRQEPFFSPYFFIAFAKTLNQGRPVHLIVVRRNGELKGILPLTRAERFFGRLPASTLRSLSGIHSCRFDLVCALHEESEVAAAMWRCLKAERRWTVIEALNIPKNGAFEAIMQHAQRDGYLVVRWPTLLNPCLRLPHRGEDPLKNCPPQYKSDRKGLERRFRRLSEAGEPHFEATSTFSEELFQDFIELEGRGWKGSKGGAIRCRPNLVAFYRNMLQGASRAGHLRFCSLTLNGKRIAMEMTFLVDQVCYSPKIAYDEAFSRFAPGQLLARWSINDLVQRGCTLYDLLGPRARHKVLWAGDVREHANCYIFQRSIGGKIKYLLVAKLAARMKRLKYRLWGDPQAVNLCESKNSI